MSIYRISQDIQNFMFFTMDDLDVYEKMEDFDIDGFGKVLEFQWNAPDSIFIESDSGSKILPDVTQWSGNDLVLSDSAKRALGNLLDHSGEYLPVGGACKDYWLFNPTCRLGNEITNLKKTKSIYFDDGSWDRVDNLVFKKGADIDVPLLFTIELDRGVTLFCNQGFKDEVEKLSLNGINFSIVEQE